jgi:hypothetical protein
VTFRRPPRSGQATSPWSSPPSSRRRRPPVPRGSPWAAADVRDGLSRVERVVLWQLGELQREFPGRSVPTATLYGRVLEHVPVSEDELQRVLSRLVGVKR